MISQLEHPTIEQSASIDFAESLKQAVITKTDNGRRIVDSIVSIMEGDAPNCTPWHQLEAAKLLRKLGIGNTPTSKTQSPSTANLMPPLPQGEGWGEGTQKIPSPSMGEGQDGGEDTQNESCPSCTSPSVNSDAQTKFTMKLVRQVRIDTGDGASIVKYLTEIMEGRDPTTRGRDRLEAIKMLLGICLDSPAFPDAEFMMQAARCHPDCFCVCEDLPEDHPEVAKMHTPPTAEQRQQLAEQQAQQEEWDRRFDETIERRKRADKAWRLAQYHEPDAKADRRIEREEQRERRQQKREQEKQQKKDSMRDLRAHRPRDPLRHLAALPTARKAGTAGTAGTATRPQPLKSVPPRGQENPSPLGRG